MRSGNGTVPDGKEPPTASAQSRTSHGEPLLPLELSAPAPLQTPPATDLEAALRESERHLHTIIELEPDCVKLLSSDGLLQEMNPAGLAMLEVTSIEDVKGHPLLEFVAPEHRDRFVDAQRAVLGGVKCDFQFIVVGRKGTRRWMETHSVPYRNGKGEIAGILAITRDISEYKRAQDEAEERERRLSTLISNLPGFAYRYRNDGEFSIDLISDGVARLSGYAAEDFRNNRRRFVDSITPDDQEWVRAAVRAALDGNEAFEITYRILRADGAVRWMWEKGRGIPDETGVITAVEGFVSDITDRKTATDDIRRREAQLTSIYDTVGESIFQLAVEGNNTYRFVSVNAAFETTTGLRSEDVVGKALHETIGPPLLESVIAQFAEAIRERKTVRWDEVAIFPAGTLQGEVTAAPLFNELGDCTHIVGAARDMTVRKQAEEELRRVSERLQVLSRRLLEIREKERRQLATDLHDELGQSLTAAKINLQSLKRFPDGSNGSSLDESVMLVDRALQQVRSLSLELRPPMLDDLGLAAAMNWLIDQHTRHFGFRIVFDNGIENRRFDSVVETACFRIAQEAFNNVARHSGAQNVAMSVEIVDDVLQLRIRDDGSGFDVEQAHTRAIEGRSIGLLGMEERAALVGGGIEWGSNPSQGTELHAWFPLSVSATKRNR